MGLTARNRRFRRLLLGRVVSFLGDGVGLVALILYVAEESGGSGTAVALLLLAGDALPSLASPVLGVAADRFDRRRVLIGCELGQALAVGLVVAARPDLPVLLALVVARSLLANLFQAAARSAVPDIVDDADLPRANALIGGGTYGLEALGPLVAAALLIFLSPLGLLAVDAVTFLVAPLLLAGLPPLPPPPGPAEPVLTATRAGLRELLGNRLLRPVAVGFVAVVACNGVDDVALVFLGRDTFGTGDVGLSLLYAASGVGLLAGFVLLSRARALPAVALAAAGFAVSSAGNLGTGVAPVLGAALAMQFLRGVGVSAMDVGPTTIVQRAVPAHLRGRVFANLYGAVGLAAGLSYAVGGPLLDLLSPRTVLAGAGAGGLLCAAAFAVSAWRTVDVLPS